jgi:DNA-binding transcriptional ArsR family regulator
VAPWEDRVYRAISDPTRRRILDLLAHGEQSVGWLVARFPFSQPAVSQHLRVLREAGLVRVRRQGRLRLYSIDPRPLRVVHGWTGLAGSRR